MNTQGSPQTQAIRGAASIATPYVGQSIPRVDGTAKVTGNARYTAEHALPGLLRCVAVTADIACGKVAAIESAAAKKLPGVRAVITHENAPRLKSLPEKVQEVEYSGEGGLIEMLLPLQSEVIYYAGQLLALVVADTLEQATEGAELVRVTYAPEPADLDVATVSWRSHPQSYCGMEPLQLQRGDPSAALNSSEEELKGHYLTPPHYHCAIETLCTVASWNRSNGTETLHIWDTTRVIKTLTKVIAHCLDIEENAVDLKVKYLGGSFGSKAWNFGNTLIIAACAKLLACPLKLEWTRRQMFEVNGYRPATAQNIRLGSDRKGRLHALLHDAQSLTSKVSGYTEPVTGMTTVMYDVPHISISQELLHLNLPTPCPMRGVGILAGGWALETALDELAHRLGIDPTALRIVNDAQRSPFSGLPFSSRHFKECIIAGKERIGWEQRRQKPGELKSGGNLIGFGMAASTLPAVLDNASARIVLNSEGRALVTSATHETGNGAYTIFRQVAADALRLPFEHVSFDLGESKFVDAPITAGSRTTASVGAAILKAGKQTLEKLKRLAQSLQGSSLCESLNDDIEAAEGQLYSISQPEKRQSFGDILRLSGLEQLSVESTYEPSEEKHSEAHSFGAIFAEVRVDADLGVIRVPRLVGVFDVGKLVNRRTALSQLKGGMITGLGAALTEEGYFHPVNGRSVLRNLADYHIPSCADLPEILTETLDIPDPLMGDLCARGLGEIGTNNVPAAIGNAFFNATGRRIRTLPLTPDRVLEAMQ